MTSQEIAVRVAAWNWASETLGQRLEPNRIKGLVEVTASVSVENLKPAIEHAIRTEPQGFLPSPGKVIACANVIADKQRSSRPAIGAGQRMSGSANDAWMAEKNPEGWTDQQWRRFGEFMHVGGSYAQQVRALNNQRHEWAEERTREAIGGRQVRAGEALRIRRDFNRASKLEMPNPCPLEFTGETA